MPIVSVESRRVFGEVCLQYVESAIVIAIANGNTHASLVPAILIYSQARLQALFGEGAVAAIVEQEARCRIAGDIDLLPAVTVQVSSHSSQPIYRRDSSNARMSSNVGERAVTI